jgi:hypothetical protein
MKRMLALLALSAVVVVLGCLAQDTDTAVAVYGFTLDETVAVRLGLPRIERTLDVREFVGTYVDFGVIQGTTGAITDYDLYVSAQASVTLGGWERLIGSGGLELRLDEGGFERAVAPPERTILFAGGNNVRNNTRFSVAARVNLLSLSEEALRSGSVVTYTVTFTVVER